MSDAALRGLLAEKLRREKMKAAIREDLFDKQVALHDDPARFKAAHPGRRGGKSESLVRSCALDVLDSGFNEAVILGAETKQKAKALHWANLQAIAIKHGLPLVPNGQEWAWLTPWGSRIQFWGVTDDGAVELLRGFKMKAARFDEVATYASKLPRLVSSVLEPALSDTGGTCTLYGTPSVTRSGPWADICLGETPGWSVTRWDVRDNKKYPRDPDTVLQQTLLRNKWTWDHPIFQREWLGMFVNDLEMQVYKYRKDRNSADGLPCPVGDGFCTLGIDYGTTDDPCAWAVIWSPKGSREVYVVETQKHWRVLPDDAAEVTRELIQRWKPRRIVGDGGGLGAPYVEAYNRRYGHISEAYVQQADKLCKLGHIAILNGEMASGRVKLLPAADDLAAEMEALPWKDEKKVKEADGYQNHCCDSALYAFTSHFTDIPRKPAPTKTQAQLEAEALADRQKRARERQGAGLLRR